MNIFTPLHNLLSPRGVSCLTCGKVISTTVRGYPELCQSCYASIPWIIAPRCSTCGRPVGCPDCSRYGHSPRSFILNRSAVSYNAMMREWLGQYKFRGHEAYGLVLSRMMGRAMRRLLQELACGKGRATVHFDAVTFVPISAARLMERGFNQAELLARGAASIGNVPLLPLLERTKHTEKQSFKNRSERLHAMEGLFGFLPDAVERLESVIAISQPRSLLDSPFLLRRREGLAKNVSLNTLSEIPLKLLLIDDVYTTGSTVDACSEVLLKVCSLLGRKGEVYCLTWARS